MEEISHEAAGSPRVQFQPLESQSECLSPELQFLQDTEMEQGFPGGKAETTLISRRMGVLRNSWAWYERGLERKNCTEGQMGFLPGLCPSVKDG